MVIHMAIPMITRTAIVRIQRKNGALAMALQGFEVPSGAPVEIFGNVKG
jgi:hypothetical protein